MSKKSILEVCDEGVIYKNIINKSFINKIKTKEWQKKLNIKGKDIDDIKVDLKNKNIFIIVQGEEIYAKLIEVPKVNKRKLYSVIKDELKYNFKNIDNIMFTYDIFKDNGKSLEVIVFCLNWNKGNIIEKCVERGGKIKGVYPIQFCALNNYKKNIKEHQYIFIFYDENKFYFLACVNKRIIANSVIKDLKKDNIIENLDEFTHKCEAAYKVDKFENIFFLNFPYKDIIESLSEKYKCSNLGTASKDKLEVP